jgi:thymidine phosphorylase
VKFGAAAFMKPLGQARELASSIVTLSRECGVNTRALLTDMDTPLGRSAGNWLEVKEAVLCLEGHGPDDLQELIIACAAHLLVQTGKCSDIAVAQHLALNCLASRAPRRKFDELVVAQGGDLETFKCRIALDHTAPVVLELRADDDGYVSRCDARIIGEIVRDLGGGRMTKDSVINPDVGIDSLAKPGDPVEKGFVLARVHAADRPSAERVRERFRQAVEISAEVPALPPLIHEVIGAS